MNEETRKYCCKVNALKQMNRRTQRLRNPAPPKFRRVRYPCGTGNQPHMPRIISISLFTHRILTSLFALDYFLPDATNMLIFALSDPQEDVAQQFSPTQSTTISLKPAASNHLLISSLVNPIQRSLCSRFRNSKL